MYTIVRSYFGRGSKELFDVAEKNKANARVEVNALSKALSATPSSAAGTADFIVTVCNDKAGADERALKRPGIDCEERRRKLA